jgi:cephalosporin-C deacetylase-like acetyl esterase
MLHPNYPTHEAIDAWSRAQLDEADALIPAVREITDSPVNSFPLGVRHHAEARHFSFTLANGESFYAYWQPSASTARMPLLIHLPGYGAEMTAHPELVALGYNVLHINPQGYATPYGYAEEKRMDGMWPVLPDTVTTCGARGYRSWLLQAITAIRWACTQPSVQPDRLATFGTSQGGGTALLLGSLLAERGVKAVAADLPFLTNFPMNYASSERGAYEIAYLALESLPPARQPDAWRALGYIDTLSHAHRLTMPVLLTAGSRDTVTPKDSIQSLFECLPATRSYTELAGQEHNYTIPFLPLAAAWFGLYV